MQNMRPRLLGPLCSSVADERVLQSDNSRRDVIAQSSPTGRSTRHPRLVAAAPLACPASHNAVSA